MCLDKAFLLTIYFIAGFSGVSGVVCSFSGICFASFVCYLDFT